VCIGNGVGEAVPAVFSFSDPPAELAKKATLIMYFANYMKISLAHVSSENTSIKRTKPSCSVYGQGSTATADERTCRENARAHLMDIDTPRHHGHTQSQADGASVEPARMPFLSVWKRVPQGVFFLFSDTSMQV
jgi:hypothetical protein